MDPLGLQKAEDELREKSNCPVCGAELVTHTFWNTRSCDLHGDYEVNFVDGKHVVVWHLLQWRIETCSIDKHRERKADG